jgi:predicted small secreted protein
MKRIAALIVVAWALAACNTIAGAGQDLQKAGETIENAAKKK